MARMASWPYAAAALTGFLMALAFPPFEASDAAWCALIPFMIACAFVKPVQVWRIGWVGGLAFWLITIFWLTRVTYVGWLLLCFYCALYFIPLALLTSVWFRHIGTSRVGFNFLYMFLASATWTGSEFVRSTIFTGFPWNPLGSSLHSNLALIQHAAWGGVYTLSALLVFVNAGIALTLLRYIQKHTRFGQKPHFELMLAVSALVVMFVTGNRMLQSVDTEGRDLRVALIQTAIPQDNKWDEEKALMIYSRLRELTGMAVDVTRPELVIWPETALPSDVRLSEPCFRTVSELASLGAPILVGSMDAELIEGRKPRYFNSSFLFDTNAVIIEYYEKRHLVLLGEYVPFHEHVRFLTAMTPIMESFSPGHTSTVFRMPGRELPFSSLICFEDTLPYLARDSVRNGARLLVNQTNDAWFDPLWASKQHMMLSIFRAVENRVPMVRAANTGVSCSIDALGRVREKLSSAAGRHDEKGFLLAQVALPPDDMPLTFYTRHGDVFAWACLIPGIACWSWAWRANRRARVTAP